MDEAGFEKWVRKIFETEEDEISCSECFDLVSRYVDLEQSGTRADEVSRRVASHLNQCKPCRDEYETLRELAILEGADKLPSLDELRRPFQQAPMDLKPIHFIAEPIEVYFNRPPALEKKPDPPARFTWRGTVFQVAEVLSEWVDYARRGRMNRNMQPQHAAVASQRGSWGVGVFYFRVRTGEGRIFDLYYDRAPKGVDQRKGAWFNYQELKAE